ncbi:hypothetical protein DFJ63DRAFT_317061 [Scheffersomyces coipomensis]|uniref:uncharacterized protein n=1 Tax=Scheffersomyces coipomensis TaxID=1788519 RepID=UPI00315D80EA
MVQQSCSKFIMLIIVIISLLTFVSSATQVEKLYDNDRQVSKSKEPYGPYNVRWEKQVAAWGAFGICVSYVPGKVQS